MNDMFTISATDARRDWSTIIDTVVREKPAFISRTRDMIMVSSLDMVSALLEPYSFTADKFVEDNGSITLSLHEIDIIVNADTEEAAIIQMAEGIKEYAEEYYREFKIWSVAPNRKAHLPYVLKALLLDDVNKIGAIIKCQLGKS